MVILWSILRKRLTGGMLIQLVSEFISRNLAEELYLFLCWLNYYVGILGERSCYDEGKRTAETLAMDYHRGAGVEVVFNYNCLID
jgi:hypothetical protein